MLILSRSLLVPRLPFLSAVFTFKAIEVGVMKEWSTRWYAPLVILAGLMLLLLVLALAFVQVLATHTSVDLGATAPGSSHLDQARPRPVAGRRAGRSLQPQPRNLTEPGGYLA